MILDNRRSVEIEFALELPCRWCGVAEGEACPRASAIGAGQPVCVFRRRLGEEFMVLDMRGRYAAWYRKNRGLK